MIAYELELQTSLTAEQVARQLVAAAVPEGAMSADTDPQALLDVDSGGYLRSGPWIRVSGWTPRLGHALETFFDRTPMVRVHIRFGLGLPGGIPPQTVEMVWLVTALLARVPGDVVLHYEYETVWLLRRDGRLYLNDMDDIWTPDLLAMVPSPYERTHLAFDV